jgi:hypothetical protein
LGEEVQTNVFDAAYCNSHAGPAERALSPGGISERGIPCVHDSHQIHRIWKRPQQLQGFDGVKKVV